MSEIVVAQMPYYLSWEIAGYGFATAIWLTLVCWVYHLAAFLFEKWAP